MDIELTNVRKTCQSDVKADEPRSPSGRDALVWKPHLSQPSQANRRDTRVYSIVAWRHFGKGLSEGAGQNLSTRPRAEDYPKMLEDLKWQLAKDQLAEAFEVKVEEKDIADYAKNITRMQFMQYGLTNVADDMLEEYSKEMLKDEKQIRGIYNRVEEVKIYEALKDKVKLVHKEIALDEFSKLFEK